MVPDAVDGAFPYLLLRSIDLLQEHYESVEGLELFQVVPIDEVSQLVVFQDQVDFVSIHQKLLFCHEIFMARRYQGNHEIQQNDIKEVYLEDELHPHHGHEYSSA